MGKIDLSGTKHLDVTQPQHMQAFLLAQINNQLVDMNESMRRIADVLEENQISKIQKK